MTNVAAPSIAVATPTSGDTVLGVQGGAVKRFTTPEIAAVVQPLIGNVAVIEDYAGATTLAKMQAALDSARPIVRGTKGTTYDLNGGTLVIHSNTMLDMTGCTISTPSTTNPMLKNEHALIAGRDANIAIIGGDWTAGAADGSTHRLLLNKVDGLIVKPRSITSTSGKYAVSLSDVTNFEVGNIVMATASDGVHVTGPASNGWIHDISGNTHDDFVVLGCSDYAAYDYSRGTVRDVAIERIRTAQTAGAGAAIKLFTSDDSGVTTTPGDMLNVAIRDVSGTVMAHGVLLLQGAGVGGFIDNILIDTVSVANAQSGYSQVQLSATNGGQNYGRITCRNISPDRSMSAVAHYGASASLQATSSVQNLTVDGVKMEDSSGAAMQAVRITGGPVDALTVRNAHGTLVNTSSRAVNVGTAATIKTLNIECALTGATLLYVGDTSVVNFLTVSGRHDSPANSAGIVHAASTLITINFNGYRLITGDFVSVQNASASMELHGTADNTAGNGFFKNSTQNVYCRSFGVRVAVDRLTKRSGDIAYNSNASLSCGLGPVYCNGTSWMHVTTGATY